MQRASFGGINGFHLVADDLSGSLWYSEHLAKKKICRVLLHK